MKFGKILAASLALSAVLGTTVMVNSADAQSLRGILNSISARGGGFNPGGGGFNAAGGGFNAGGASAINAMNSTAATLNSMISNGVATGRINGAQAASFQAELEQITNMQGSFMADGSLTASETQNLYNQYASLTSQVNGAVNGGFGNNQYGTSYTPYSYPNNSSGVYNPWY